MRSACHEVGTCVSDTRQTNKRMSVRPIRFIVIAAVVVVVVLSMPCPPTHTAHSAART
jgi:hypothetical protein